MLQGKLFGIGTVTPDPATEIGSHFAAQRLTALTRCQQFPNLACCVDHFLHPTIPLHHAIRLHPLRRNVIHNGFRPFASFLTNGHSVSHDLEGMIFDNIPTGSSRTLQLS
ncbi:uncharacterized protein METZ01_LOCUS360001, partial [marine metagenome]